MLGGGGLKFRIRRYYTTFNPILPGGGGGPPVPALPLTN